MEKKASQLTMSANYNTGVINTNGVPPTMSANCNTGVINTKTGEPTNLTLTPHTGTNINESNVTINTGGDPQVVLNLTNLLARAQEENLRLLTIIEKLTRKL